MTERSLNVQPLSLVTMTRQRFAWTNVVPQRTITILAGQAGIAKSTVLAWLIAHWTKGELEGDLKGQPINVAIINGEDDVASVLVPRLVAAGADLERIQTLSSVTVHEDDGDWITSPNLAEDLALIREKLIEWGSKVLIIDPIISLMRGDSHRLEDVRRNLDPLASMAADLGIAVVCVAHFNKGSGNAGDKVSGSHAFRDIARSLIVLAVDDETDDRIMTVEKSNYSPVKPSYAFRVDSIDVPTGDGDTNTVGKAVLLGHSDLTVNDLLNRDTTVLGDRSADVIEYVNGHREGVRAEDIAAVIDAPVNQARTYLSRLAGSGRIARLARGVYGPAERNANTTTTTPFASVASVANLPNATHTTHATGVTRDANVLRTACPIHGSGLWNGSCTQCELETSA